MDKPTAAPAGGAKEKIEKQARQLAYDTRYKVKQTMAAKAGGKSDPVTVKKAYAAQLAKSSAAPAVKMRAKQMLLGEDLVDTKRLATESVVSALYNVFVTGEVEQKVEEVEDAYLLQLEETGETKYKIRVTDKKTGNSYVRMATRAKISELRANPNISSVEMTGYGEPTRSEKVKGSSTAKAKAGKGLDPVGQEDADPNNNGIKNDPSDKYIMKRRKAVGKAIATRKEDYNWQDGFAELIEKKKEEKTEKKLTGEGVNNSKLVTVFPDSEKNIKEEKEEKKEDKKADAEADAEKKDAVQDKQTVALQKKTLMAKLQQLQKGVPLSQEEIEIEGGQIDEKITAKTDMGMAIKDFYASKSPQLAGRTKEERRKAAIAAVLTARRGGRKLGEEACGCDEKEPKLKKSEGGVEDPREIPTKLNLAKNKLRAMGLKMSYEPEGEQIDEFLFGPSKVTPKNSPTGTKSVEVDKKYPARQNGAAVDVTYDKGGNKKVTPMPAGRAGLMQYKHGSTWGMQNQSFEPEGNQLDEFNVNKALDAAAAKVGPIIDKGVNAVFGKPKPRPTAPVSTPAARPAATTPRPAAKPAASRPQTASAAMAQAFKGTPLSGVANVANAYDRRANYRDQPPEVRKMMGLQNSYEVEGEVIDERRREDKGKPRGPEPSAAFKAVSAAMGSGRMGVQPRGQKKVPGKKPPAAGQYGAPASPAQKVEKIRAAKKRAQDNMSSRFD